jgi:hypothetical protein
MSTYQNLVTEVEQRVSEAKRRNMQALRLPSALKAKFEELMEMPREMCQVGIPHDSSGDLARDLRPEDGKLEFSVGVLFPESFGVGMFLIPVSVAVVGNSYRAAVGSYSHVSIPFSPEIDQANLLILARHVAEYFRARVGEFLK